MVWGVEVWVRDLAKTSPARHWVRMHPTGGDAYIWGTWAEADRVRRGCYPDSPDVARTVKVS
jgi:hypothetical protein